MHVNLCFATYGHLLDDFAVMALFIKLGIEPSLKKIKSATWVENEYDVIPETTSIEDTILCLSDCSCELTVLNDSYCSKKMGAF